MKNSKETKQQEPERVSIPVDTDVRHLPKQEQRVETGQTQFGNDWKGLFIRGDDCARIYCDLMYLFQKATNADLLEPFEYAKIAYLMTLFDLPLNA